MTAIRQRVLNAAIDLVGTEGLRSLTHARVDARAGVPAGTTSNYFRTRAALLAGVADWIVDRELNTVRPAFGPRTVDDLVDALASLVEFTTGPNRVFTTARLVLFLEASHDPALAQTLDRGRSAMESEITAALRALGAVDAGPTASALMAACEGIILHRIARSDDADPRTVLGAVARGTALSADG